MPTSVSHHYLIRLTQEEIKEMCKSEQSTCEQVKSFLHIMVRCGRRMYKLVHDASECMFLLDVSLVFTSHPNHFVVPKRYNRFLFMYHMVPLRSPFGLLRREEASQSLKTLVKKIILALDELHTYRYCSHNDVRLPNIAFNENYEAVLIDLDRGYPCDKIHPYFKDPKIDSC